MKASQHILNRHWPTLIDNFGVPVEYCKVGGGSASLTLVKGRRGIDPANLQDVFASKVADEWFALTTDLRAVGVPQPSLNDRIRWTTPFGTIEECELYIASQGRGWDTIDNEGLISQIFTNIVSQSILLSSLTFADGGDWQFAEGEPWEVAG
jgi:hypothetical protein